MKLATVKLNLSKEGHEVFRENVTPAELALLVAEHHTNSGGKPIDTDEKGDFTSHALKLTGDTSKIPVLDKDGKQEKDEKGNLKFHPPRTNAEEKARLFGRYNAAKVNAMYPGPMPNMPTDFKEAYKLGLGTVLPSSKLTEVKLA